MILTRVQVESWDMPNMGDLPVNVSNLIETARAYHDLRDAVLGLHRPGFPDRDGQAECKECFGDWPCATAQAVKPGGAS